MAKREAKSGSSHMRFFAELKTSLFCRKEVLVGPARFRLTFKSYNFMLDLFNFEHACISPNVRF